MTTQQVNLGACRFEVLTEGNLFIGLGAIFIGETQVRSGRLPLRPTTQTFGGLELAELRLLDVASNESEVRVRLSALFRPLPVKLMRDHSLDPIHETGDWGAPIIAGEGALEIVIEPARDCFGGVEFEGFSYRYEYSSPGMPLFTILDQASWELDGDIEGATAISQSSCSAPVATFTPDKAWTTEGVLHWLEPGTLANDVMTHNLPRWASHGSFDFQYKGDDTLLGVFEKVELIRTVLRRDAGKAELKTFDKYIFDQALQYRSPGKKILLNRDAKTQTDQKNLWTWVFDEVHERARAEYGLREELSLAMSFGPFRHFHLAPPFRLLFMVRLKR